MYNGIGINANLHSDNRLKYLAVGCPTFGWGSGPGFIYSCGVGVGIVSTNIIPQNKNKHGIAVHVGVLHINRDAGKSRNEVEAGIGYTYFTQGINSAGWNFGVLPVYQFVKDINKIGLYLQIGYQL